MNEISRSLLRDFLAGEEVRHFANWQWDYVLSDMEGVIPEKGNLLQFCNKEEIKKLLIAMEKINLDVIETRIAASYISIVRGSYVQKEKAKAFVIWTWRRLCGVFPALITLDTLLEEIKVEFGEKEIVLLPNERWAGRIIGKRGGNIKKVDSFFSALGKRVRVRPPVN